VTKRVFISYRRHDTAASARLLFDRLHNLVLQAYLDVATIKGGEDFEKSIESAIAKSDVVLVLIGKDWVKPEAPAGRPRLAEETDYVRAEVRTALARPVLVLPILVDGAKMPDPAVLPEDVRAITTRNAVFLRHESFEDDTENIIAAVLGVERARRAWNRKRNIARSIASALVGLAIGTVATGVIALVHNAIWSRPVSASIGTSATILLLIACPLLGIWGGLKYMAGRQARLRR
jgi:hypothetical protein